MRCLFTAALVLTVAVSAFSQDTVTIPKSRLEELEKKEAELQRLKGATVSTNPAPAATPTVTSAAPQAAPSPAPQPKPLVAHPTPSTPLPEGEVVEANELAAQYRTDAAAADKRYYKKKFTIRGEIAGFEKPVVTSNYKVVLKTDEPQSRVVCDFVPPENASPVFTINHGLALATVVQKERVPFARVGDAVLIEGQCRGWHGQAVTFYARKMTAAR